MVEDIKIPISNLKIILVFIGALTFVLLGILILLDTEGLTSAMFRSEILNKSIAVIAIIFFGLIAFTVPRKLFGKKIGLILNEQGIIDYSNLSSIGLIEWKDIQEIRRERYKNSGFLLVYTDKPEKYISKARNKFKRALLKGNNKTYGTPLSITATILKIKLNELERIVNEAYEITKNTPQELKASTDSRK